MQFNFFFAKIMQINIRFLQVLFVLSTIVLVTDCCSSKIISLKEQTLKMVYQQKQLQQQQHQQQQFQNPLETTQKIPQHVELATETNFGKIANSSSVIDGEYNNNNNSMLYAIDASYMLNETTTTLPASDNVESLPDTNSSREAKFQIIDLYYTIMRDVLSFECSGQYVTDFCLNRGRCFRYPVGNHSFFSCECADGFVGERCESKSLNDYYVPHRGKRSTKVFNARLFFSFPTLIVISAFHVLIGLLVVLRNNPGQRSHSDTVVSFKRVTGDDAATVTAVIA